MRFPSLSSTALLTLFAPALAGAQSTPERFDHDIEPSFRDTASGHYAGWDSFTSAFGGPNAPDDPATDLSTHLEQLAPGALITSGGNIYSPAGPTTFAIESDLAGSVHEVVVQLRTQGSPLDPTGFALELDVSGSVVPVPMAGSQDLGPSGGPAAETLVRFDVPPGIGGVHGLRVLFAASAAHMSLDAVMVDVRAERRLGSTYCTAYPNSTGAVGSLAAFGSADPLAGAFELRVESLPAQVFGLFLTSRDAGQVPHPVGSAGVLCLGGQIGRFSAGTFNSGASGAHDAPIDLASLPTPTGFVSAASGDVWRFQCWHRDVHQGAGSNFTLPVAVTIP